MDKSLIDRDAALLTLTEVASYLKVAERTVTRMLGRGEIPAVKIANQWRFSREALDEWLMSGMRSTTTGVLKELQPGDILHKPLSRLIPDGCIFTEIGPAPLVEIFTMMAEPLERSGLVEDSAAFVGQLMAREAIVPTAVGAGIALPHARKPAAPPDHYGLAIGISPGGVDFKALDGQLVNIIVMVCSDSVSRHLEIMAQVALVLREALVVEALRDAQTPQDVLATLIERDQRQLFAELTARSGAL